MSTLATAVTQADLSIGAKVTVTSQENSQNLGANLVDGNPVTRWSSLYADPQTAELDLGGNFAIKEIDLVWQNSAGKNYLVQTSLDGTNWTTVPGGDVTGNMTTGLITYKFPPVVARYIRMYGTARVTKYGYSLFAMPVIPAQPEDIGAALGYVAGTKALLALQTAASN